MATRALVVDRPRLAVPVWRVRRVVAAPVLTPVPTAPPVVLGLVNVRGVVVPVLDAGLLAGDGPVGDPAFVIVVETASGFAGLAVPTMPATADVDDADLTDADALVAARQ